MILVDTNVLSELWKIAPAANVLNWIDAQAVETLYLSAITVAELRFGLATMPQGKRRTIYQERLEREVLPAFTGRVLPFDLGRLTSLCRADGAGKGNRQSHQHGRWLYCRYRARSR
ncbi:MAG: PIN domain-containing protein, partial [Pseudomonadales bacterium]|nr:PIN domain-containing protein [Pseudomonadales bacterium]